MLDYATARYSSFINSLGGSVIYRCFLKLDPASNPLGSQQASENRVSQGVITAKIKLANSAVDAAKAQAQPVELPDTLVCGLLRKITPTGRKVFMLQYRTNAGEGRKPALGLYGELTVEQARSLAQEWLAQVRRVGDPAAEKAAARQVPTVKERYIKFMKDYSSQRNKPSTTAAI